MSTAVDRNRPTSRAQDAVRILLIIAAAGTPLAHTPDGDPALADAVAILESQVLLQKLDFWVRNPDYFAMELLKECERCGDFGLAEQAEAIMKSDEPEVRRYPMIRFLFGAYEQLDDALAVLRSANLVVRRTRGSGARIQRHDYYLTRLGRETADRILHEAPAFAYFVDRTRLVAKFAGGLRGTHLKDRQYEQQEYRNTPIGDHIASIAPRVREHLRQYAETLRRNDQQATAA